MTRKKQRSGSSGRSHNCSGPSRFTGDATMNNDKQMETYIIKTYNSNISMLIIFKHI